MVCRDGSRRFADGEADCPDALAAIARTTGSVTSHAFVGNIPESLNQINKLFFSSVKSRLAKSMFSHSFQDNFFFSRCFPLLNRKIAALANFCWSAERV